MKKISALVILAVLLTVGPSWAFSIGGGYFPDPGNQFQSQSQSQGQSQAVGPVSQTANPTQKTSIETTNLGLYPWPWTTPMPSMQTPNAPKTWQLSLTLWDDQVFPYGSIVTTIPANVEIHGRLISKARGKAESVRIYKGKDRPKGFYRIGSYVVVAKTKDVDATVLEDAAMYQARKDGASGIVERDRGFYAQNNIKGSAGGVGIALSILGSIAGNMTQFGPTGGFQSGSYVSNQDVFVYLAFDVIEVQP